MKTIKLTGTGPALREVLRMAESEGLILRTEDGREYIVAEVDDFEREVELTSRNPELMALLKERSKDTSALSVEEVRRQLGI